MNKVMQYWTKFAFILPLIVIICGCNGDDDDTKSWELVWEDNFDGLEGESPDASKWTYNIGTDWGNRQLEYDTDRPENVSLDGQGNLLITARKENFAGSGYTSARITTQGLFEQTYGRFEARIKMPLGRGLWPAFWMLGTECIPGLKSDGSCCFGTEGWPDCGEIDIVEMRGQLPQEIAGSLHGPGYSGGNPVSKEYTLDNDRFDLDFHEFAVEWTEEYIDYFIDNIPYQRINRDDVPGNWVFNNDFYIILNLAVGGNYVGSPDEFTMFPQTMTIDWVRVYIEK